MPLTSHTPPHFLWPLFLPTFIHVPLLLAAARVYLSSNVVVNHRQQPPTAALANAMVLLYTAALRRLAQRVPWKAVGIAVALTPVVALGQGAFLLYGE